jgi:hypothetical protein
MKRLAREVLYCINGPQEIFLLRTRQSTDAIAKLMVREQKKGRRELSLSCLAPSTERNP